MKTYPTQKLHDSKNNHKNLSNDRSRKLLLLIVRKVVIYVELVLSAGDENRQSAHPY